MQESRHKVRISASQAVLSWMQPTLHATRRMPASQAVLCRMRLTLHATRRAPHGASHLVHAMSAWSVKTRRAPSQRNRDARVYGLVHTLVHWYITRSAPPFPLAEGLGLQDYEHA